MLLSDLLKQPVLDASGAPVGVVIDARFRQAPDSRQATLVGLLIGRRVHSAFLGYERKSETAPALIARYLRWRGRGTFLVMLDDVRSIEHDAVRLRAGYTRYSPVTR